MKSVFKTVAPFAMSITFALSGVAMAETASNAAKSADTATEKVATSEAGKPVVNHKGHVAKEGVKAEAATPVATTPTTTAPAAEKPGASKPTAAAVPIVAEKAAPAVAAGAKTEPVKAK